MRVFVFICFISCTIRAFATTGDSDIDGILEDIRHSNYSENSSNDIKNDSSSQSQSSSFSPDFDLSSLDHESSSKSISNKTTETFTSSSAWNELTASTKNDLEALTQLFNAVTTSSSEEEYMNSSQSSQFSSSQTISGRHSTIFSINATSSDSTSSSPSDEEAVVLGTQKPIPIPKTMIQKTIEWMSNAYTMSILLPVAAGIVFAATIIVVIAACSCMRRRCRRRRIRKKILPDSVKNMRPSDRARLLADTSDEEF